MGSDGAMANTSVPAVISKDIGKKKRNNRSAKLKQCKLDARREQWLSQVKNKGCKVTKEHVWPPSLSPSHLSLPRVGKGDGSLRDNSKTRRPIREENGVSIPLHDSDLDSPINSPTSSISGNNSLRKDCPANSVSSGSYSRSISDADEEEEGGEASLDDWEAVADALTAGNNNHTHQNSEPNTTAPESHGSLEPQNGSGILKKPEPNRTIPKAWRPDDAFRPQSLPNLSKQRSFPLNLERYCSHGTMVWAHHGIVSQPTSCPICYEDLDLTDSSFLPCSCGFRLCLFCHKRILEADGRCPGCRKQYSPVVDGEMDMNGGGAPLLSMRLSRSCSMSSRS